MTSEEMIANAQLVNAQRNHFDALLRVAKASKNLRDAEDDYENNGRREKFLPKIESCALVLDRLLNELEEIE